MSIFQQSLSRIKDTMLAGIEGEIADVVGLTIECEDFSAPVGAMCEIRSRHTGDRVEAEVVGFRESRSILMPYGEMRGLSRGDPVLMLHAKQTVPVGDALIGRVLDSRGMPIDGKAAPLCPATWNIYQPAPNAFTRPVITQPITTGIRAIDGLFTCGRGQRMGIFSGSGVGKSTLLSMITRDTDADMVVLGLVGERGRELREFIEKDLGEEGLKRAVVVCETSDRPPLARVKCAFTATAVAEYFRSRGANVMLLMDSLTRMAMAQREIGLSAGEPPTTKGYPPSVFNIMPRLLERSGADASGSITAFYTVLVEGDDMNEPISDTVRGILDGHIWLSRDLANKGHFPAIDVNASISRLMSGIAPEDHKEAALRFRELYATYSEAEDLINIGAYRAGSNATIDEAIARRNAVIAFLRQKTVERRDMPTTVGEMQQAVFGAIEGAPLPGQSPQRGGRMGLPGDISSALGAMKGGSGLSMGMQSSRQVGASPPNPNERIVRPGQQRMPAQQPPVAPARTPIRPKGL